jgi:hypothetical protein
MKMLDPPTMHLTYKQWLVVVQKWVVARHQLVVTLQGLKNKAMATITTEFFWMSYNDKFVLEAKREPLAKSFVYRICN